MINSFHGNEISPDKFKTLVRALSVELHWDN